MNQILSSGASWVVYMQTVKRRACSPAQIGISNENIYIKKAEAMKLNLKSFIGNIGKDGKVAKLYDACCHQKEKAKGCL